jgi:hypothetical protein
MFSKFFQAGYFLSVDVAVADDVVFVLNGGGNGNEIGILK